MDVDRKKMSLPLGERASDFDVYNVVDCSENVHSWCRGHDDIVIVVNKWT